MRTHANAPQGRAQVSPGLLARRLIPGGLGGRGSGGCAYLRGPGGAPDSGTRAQRVRWAPRSVLGARGTGEEGGPSAGGGRDGRDPPLGQRGRGAEPSRKPSQASRSPAAERPLRLPRESAAEAGPLLRGTSCSPARRRALGRPRPLGPRGGAGEPADGVPQASEVGRASGPPARGLW